MRRFALIAGLLVLGACSKEKNVEPPAELADFEETLAIERVWTAGVGGGEPELRLGLGVTSDGGRAYAAGHDGDVAAFDLSDGSVVWRTRTKAPLSGGTGAEGDLVAVGSSRGEVIALDAASGEIRWRVRVSGEVLAAPAVAAAAVVVRTVDGRLVALARDDGRELWSLEQQIPRLTLRGTSAPVVVGDLVICGFDNGKVIAASMKDGTIVWETAVAPPRGRTELERLADIDARVKIVESDVYAVGFQGRAAMLALETGQIWWSRDLSSYRGLAVGDEEVYVATAEGDIVSLSRRTGAEVWRQEKLARRGLSAPALIGGVLAVADFEGYVHFLDRATGEFVARVKTSGERVSNPLVTADNLLLVINDEGRVTALRPKT